MEWYLKVVRDNYANFNGRARRKEYWMYFLFHSIFAFAIMVFDAFIEAEFVIYFIYIIIFLFPSLAVGIRRLHDTDHSGWWLLFGAVPLVGPLTVFVFTCLDSTPGSNKYGPNPKAIISNVEQETIIEQEPVYQTKNEDSHDEQITKLNPIVLNIESGENKGSFYPVSGVTTIGRAHDNDIVIDLKTVSGYHCKIIVENENYVLVDLDSTNGTFVNGQAIKESVIDEGSVIELSKVMLKVTV